MTKFEKLFESVMDTYDSARIRPQSIVVIDKDALNTPEIREDLIKRKGPAFFSQLQKMCNDNQNLYVSAMKTIRSVNQIYAASPHTELLEADVINYVPGLIGTWGHPLTLPVSILRVSVPPEMIMQVPVPGHEHETGNSTGDNSYNDGKQHPNVVGQKTDKKK
jgi:hypothetical protein